MTIYAEMLRMALDRDKRRSNAPVGELVSDVLSSRAVLVGRRGVRGAGPSRAGVRGGGAGVAGVRGAGAAAGAAAAGAAGAGGAGTGGAGAGAAGGRARGGVADQIGDCLAYDMALVRLCDRVSISHELTSDQASPAARHRAEERLAERFPSIAAALEGEDPGSGPPES